MEDTACTCRDFFKKNSQPKKNKIRMCLFITKEKAEQPRETSARCSEARAGTQFPAGLLQVV